MEQLFRSILDMDRAPVVVCDLNHTIVYMNDAAKKAYHDDLTGKSVMDCHPKQAQMAIEKVLNWFKESNANNMIYTFDNQKENKDVYMVALRDANKELIGYYEKHEYRNKEVASLYDFSNSLV